MKFTYGLLIALMCIGHAFSLGLRAGKETSSNQNSLSSPKFDPSNSLKEMLNSEIIDAPSKNNAREPEPALESPVFKETSGKLQTEDIAEEHQHFYYANPDILYKNVTTTPGLKFKDKNDELEKIEMRKGLAAADFIF